MKMVSLEENSHLNLHNKFLVDACDAVQFVPVNDYEDFDKEKGYSPAMCHQIYGESELIHGYKDLTVKMYYNPAQFDMHLSIKYSEKSKSPKSMNGNSEQSKTSIDDVDFLNEVYVDDIEKLVKESHEVEPISSREDFIDKLKAAKNFKPYGDLCSKFSSNNKNFEVYHIDSNSKDYDSFYKYYYKFGVMVLYYVDAATVLSYDNKWSFYVIYEFKEDDKIPYKLASFMTYYSFYAYYDQERLRIAQILTLPTYRNNGLGAKLLTQFYEDASKRELIKEITIEDPSREFLVYKTYVDTEFSLKNDEFRDEMKEIVDKCEAEFSLDTFQFNVKHIQNMLLKLFKFDGTQSSRIFLQAYLYYLPRESDAQEKLFKRVYQCYKNCMNYDLPANVGVEEGMLGVKESEVRPRYEEYLKNLDKLDEHYKVE